MKIVRIFILLATVSLLVVGCKNRKSDKQAQVDTDWKLVIEHIGCRGSCPDYRIEVMPDGNVSYVGNHAVEMMGNYSKKIAADKVASLNKILTEYNFENFDEVYGGGVADLPYVRMTVTRNGSTKKVENIRNAPKELTEMQSRLENTIGADGYSKAE